MKPRTETDSGFTLYAPVTKEGWFDLNMLNEFCTTQLDPICDSEFRNQGKGITYFLNFNAVRKWDISVLLWLATALQYYRKEGLNFKIRLPEVDDLMNEYQYNDAIKSADYLRRWKFDIALSHVDSVERLLVSDQRDYFKKPIVVYKETEKVYSIDGRKERPVSNRLTSIRDLSTFSDTPGEGHISSQKIEECINEFHDITVAHVLKTQCGLSEDIANSFALYLVGETLLNVQQHPGATSAFMAISKLHNEGRLILAVVDNGYSIQKTIANVYGIDKDAPVDSENIKDTHWSVRADALDFATKPYITSKEKLPGVDSGMGLTYVKEDAVDKFGGELSIISESVYVKYINSSKNPPISMEWPHKWPGNLIRISLPIKTS